MLGHIVSFNADLHEVCTVYACVLLFLLILKFSGLLHSVDVIVTVSVKFKCGEQFMSCQCSAKYRGGTAVLISKIFHFAKCDNYVHHHCDKQPFDLQTKKAVKKGKATIIKLGKEKTRCGFNL